MKRIPELDALRAVAAVVVIWSHAAMASSAFKAPLVMRWGPTAVDLFFVISGYLITTIILAEKDAPGFFPSFYARRSLRIWPIYYFSLLGFLVLNVLLRMHIPMQGLPYYLLYMQNVPHYWHSQGAPFCKAFGHTWSLAVEEQFYLIWPALVCLLGRRKLATACVAIAGLGVGLRAAGWLDSQLLLTRCDGLALGALLALALEDREAVARQSRTYLLGFAALAGGCLAALVGLNAAYWAEFLRDMEDATRPVGAGAHAVQALFNVLYVALVGLCVCGTGRPWLAPLRNGPIRYVGTISYGLYLYHNLIIALMPKVTGRDDQTAPMMAAALGLTVAVSAMSWRFLERPILGWKGRFAYRARSEAAPITRPAA